MTLERILKAAVSSMVRGHHAPHCYSAHVVGKGYVNDGSAVYDRTDYLRQLERTATSEVENLNYAEGYAEPGYDDPKCGVLFANWNYLPRDLDRILERAGYVVEWSDEWSTCECCNKAVRTSANSYSWQPYYVILNDCEIVCLNCVDWAEYLESIEDDPHKAVVRKCDPSEYGYHRLSEPKEYENGFHPGQNDDPATILKALHENGRHHIVFRIPTVGQFDVTFETWQRNEDNDAD